MPKNRLTLLVEPQAVKTYSKNYCKTAILV